jgi:hypothetical protein
MEEEEIDEIKAFYNNDDETSRDKYRKASESINRSKKEVTFLDVKQQQEHYADRIPENLESNVSPLLMAKL